MNEKLLLDIDKFLNNEMTAQEQKDFKINIENNKELKDELILQQSVLGLLGRETSVNYVKEDLSENKRLKEINNVLNTDKFVELSKVIKNEGEKYEESEEKISLFANKNIRRFMSIAAIFVLFFSAYKFINISSPSYYDQYADWQNLPSMTEKGDDESKLVKVENWYNNKQYEKVINSYSSNESKKSTYELIYLGASFVKSGEYEKANKVFDELITSNSLESSRGNWYKVLVYLKISEQEKAINELEFILKDKENYNFNKARELYEKLKK